MKEFIMSIPSWYWMVIIALIVVPMSYSIFKNGIKAKIETKLGSAEIDADEEDKPEAADVTK